MLTIVRIFPIATYVSASESCSMKKSILERLFFLKRRLFDLEYLSNTIVRKTRQFPISEKMSSKVNVSTSIFKRKGSIKQKKETDELTEKLQFISDSLFKTFTCNRSFCSVLH